MSVSMLQQAWTARSQRERLLIAAAALLVAGCLIAAGAQTLARARAKASDRLVAATAEHRDVITELARLRPADQPIPRAGGPEVDQVARQQAEALGLEIALEARGDHITFSTEGVPAADLFRWLSALEKSYGVRAQALGVERTDRGLVTAEGRLVQH